MIEHRLYSIERFAEHPRVKTAGRVEGKLLLCTPKDATLYALQGWTIFDITESLGLEPHYYENATRYDYSTT